MSEQRLIDADALNKRFEKLKEGVSLIDAVFLNGAMSAVDNSPTIDPETLPIVQDLRAKLERYEQAEQDGRFFVMPKINGKSFDDLIKEAQDELKE